MHENLRLRNQLCFALYSATNVITRMYTGKLREIGLTYPQFLTLIVLWERDGQPVGEIASRLGLDSGTLTPLLKRLESGGWVDRHRDSRDERVVLVSLTEAGKRIQDRIATLQHEVACSTGLDDEEFDELKDSLHALTESMLQGDETGTAVA